MHQPRVATFFPGSARASQSMPATSTSVAAFASSADISVWASSASVATLPPKRSTASTRLPCAACRSASAFTQSLSPHHS